MLLLSVTCWVGASGRVRRVIFALEKKKVLVFLGGAAAFDCRPKRKRDESAFEGTISQDLQSESIKFY